MGEASKKDWRVNWRDPEQRHTDPWEHGTIAEFLIAFSGLIPEGLSLYMLPEAVVPIMVFSAQKYTERIAEALEVVPFGGIDDLGKISNDGRDSLLLCLQPMMVGYLATQFLYRRDLKPLGIELHRLKARMAESTDRPLETLISPRLSSILSAVHDALLVPEFAKNELVKTFLQERPGAQEALSEVWMLTMTAGATMWFMADSVSSPIDPISMATAKVFLSYSSADRQKVSKIERELNLQGIDTWRDEKRLIPGEPLLDTIREGINTQTDLTVLFMSEHSLQSRWVSTEIRMAYQRELQLGRTVLIPVLLSNCVIPPELHIKKYVDARRGIKKPVEEISYAIKWHSTRISQQLNS